MKTRVILFRESGKYYTEENWEVPEGAIIPADMERSPDFRRIAGGPVLVTSDAWGYPHLFPAVEKPMAVVAHVESEALELFRSLFATDHATRIEFAIDEGGVKFKINGGVWTPPIGKVRKNG